MRECNSCDVRHCSVVRGNSLWPKDRSLLPRSFTLKYPLNLNIPCPLNIPLKPMKTPLGLIALVNNPQGLLESLQECGLKMTGGNRYET